MESTGKLAVLGIAVASGYFLLLGGLAAVGAAAIMSLTPAVLRLGIAIINMTTEVSSKVTPSQTKKAVKIIEAVTDLISKLAVAMDVL